MGAKSYFVLNMFIPKQWYLKYPSVQILYMSLMFEKKSNSNNFGLQNLKEIKTEIQNKKQKNKR
jgi:hypothetical protein